MSKFNEVWSGSSFTRNASDVSGLPNTPAEREAAFTALLQSSSGLKRVAFAM